MLTGTVRTKKTRSLPWRAQKRKRLVTNEGQEQWVIQLSEGVDSAHNGVNEKVVGASKTVLHMYS